MGAAQFIPSRIIQTAARLRVMNPDFKDLYTTFKKRRAISPSTRKPMEWALNSSGLQTSAPRAVCSRF